MSKMLKATYGTADKPLVIAGIEIPCYVLEDGKRVIVQRGLFKALGMQVGGASGKYKEFGGAARLAAFLDKYDLSSFSSKGLEPLRNPIIFTLNNSIHNGYEAILLQEIVRAIAKAYLKGELTKAQEHIGQNAEVLDDAFAKVGIIALVDEATGYQEAREKTALRDFLEKFLSEQKGRWVKTFPDDFFEAIFKMKGWNWATAIKGQKPGVVGRYINNYVWARIAPGVLTELNRINPKNEVTGKRKAKNPQFIDIDFGHPKLKEHLNILTAFARATGYNWNNWSRMVEKAFPKFESDGSAAQEIDFIEE